VILLIGYLAAIIDVGQFLPQLTRTIARRVDDAALGSISIVSFATATVQAVLWTIYGFATNRLPIALPNVVIAPACAAVLAIAARSRRRVRRSQQAGWQHAE